MFAAALLAQYRACASAIVVENADQHKVYRHTANLRMEAGTAQSLVETSLQAARDELVRGLGGLLGQAVPVTPDAGDDLPDGAVIVGTRDSSSAVRQYVAASELTPVGDEGYVLRTVYSGNQAGLTAFNRAGNFTDLDVAFDYFRIASQGDPVPRLQVGAGGTVGGTVPATLLAYTAPGEQRRRDDRPQTDDRPHGVAAHRQLRQDADVHLVHHEPIDH